MLHERNGDVGTASSAFCRVTALLKELICLTRREPLIEFADVRFGEEGRLKY